MTDKLKAALVSEMATIIWRAVILCLIMLSTWTFQRQVGRIDAHDQKINDLQQFMSNEFVKKSELCELKEDVKTIKASLGNDLPEIKFFMGEVSQYIKMKESRRDER